MELLPRSSKTRDLARQHPSHRIVKVDESLEHELAITKRALAPVREIRPYLIKVLARFGAVSSELDFLERARVVYSAG